jgi:hypothetical protein|tara:strand:- start:2405 stop:2818 length:414 start_codon:yes stop_codon:yes gene_type:complete
MFKKLFSRNKKSKEQPKEETRVFLLYSVDEDGTIDLDFRFNVDSIQSGELFSEMFHQLNSGQLTETSVEFIHEKLQDLSFDVAEQFSENVKILDKLSNNPILSSLVEISKVNPVDFIDDVVVKPSDIAKNVLGGENP